MSDDIPTAKSTRTPKADAAEAPVAMETPVDAPVAAHVEAPVEAAHETRAERIEAEKVAEPALAEPALVEPAAAEPIVAPAVVAPAAVEPALVEPVAMVPAEATATGEVAPLVAGSGVAGQVVYVTAPVPPRVRGNRVVGSLLAILGAVIFAGLYGVVSALIIDLQSGDLFGPTFGSFLGSAFFWVPGLVFLVGMVLLTIVLNRAGWWAHVLGSLVLAIAVYFGMIGVLLLIGNVFHGSPEPITFATLAINPWVIAAAIVAREVSIWIGLAIAARGRRVKARNVESRAAFDREQEEKKAEYDRGTAAA